MKKVATRIRSDKEEIRLKVQSKKKYIYAVRRFKKAIILRDNNKKWNLKTKEYFIFTEAEKMNCYKSILFYSTQNREKKSVRKKLSFFNSTDEKPSSSA